jgi:hypothetical protein
MTMKTFAIVLGTITLAAILLAGGVWLGTTWAQGRWDSNLMGYGARGSALMGGNWSDVPCSEDSQGYAMQRPESGGGMGSGMMGSGWGDMPCGQGYAIPGEGDVSSLQEVETTVHDYMERLGYTGLEVTEVMEFERNYYAIVVEQDTGIGAMELLVDKDSGVVGPEPGPNMMWNAKYGMMGRGGGMMGMRGPELGEGMGGYASGEMTLSPQEAEDVAQRWLDANLPGRTAGEADEFYGYYTLHFLNDGRIEGMLSVHGSSGKVWYHSWHGGFITMTQDHS